MILRKPYMLFIKLFKPIHIIISIILAYGVYATNNIVIFLNNYINSNQTVVGQSIKAELASSSLYTMPIILILLSLFILGIMFYKNKPTVFYIICSLVFLAVLIINLYIINFLGLMEKEILALKAVKLNHDLALIAMIIEVVYFILFLTRGLGLNIKKFAFNADISNFDISEADKEEFELNINVDIDFAKRKRRKKLRYLKYYYEENKLIINSVICILLVLILLTIYFVFVPRKTNVEGKTYFAKDFDFRVNNTYLIKEDYKGNVLTENYLVVVDVSLKSAFNKTMIFVKDFSLQVEQTSFVHEKKYLSNLVDIGQAYNGDALENEFVNYIFVFEVPEKYIKSDFFFSYNDEGEKIQIKLNPKNHKNNSVDVSSEISKSITFKDTIGDISFTINSFELADKFLIKYNYCITEDDCIPSKEYIKPTINQNFDKVVLKLDVNYKNNSNLNIENFYQFVYSFGTIYYKIGDKWYYQGSKFEQLTSKKTNNGNNIYIAVNEDILNANSIKFAFNIRDSKYEYMLK